MLTMPTHVRSFSGSKISSVIPSAKSPEPPQIVRRNAHRRYPPSTSSSHTPEDLTPPLRENHLQLSDFQNPIDIHEYKHSHDTPISNDALHARHEKEINNIHPFSIHIATPANDLNNKHNGSYDDKYSKENYRSPLLRRLFLFISSIKFKQFIMAVILLSIIRFSFITWWDKNKMDSVSIVYITGDLSSYAVTNDPVQHAIRMSAINSWNEHVVGRNILIFAANEESCSSLPRNIKCFPLRCFHHQYPEHPLLSCIFEDVLRYSSTKTIVLVSGDFILLPSFFHAIQKVQSTFNHPTDRFLIAGAKTSTVASSSLPHDFTQKDFYTQLSTSLVSSKVPSSTSSEADVFAFSKTLFENIPLSKAFPPFLYGSPRWQQWFLSFALMQENVATIDLKSAALVIEQTKSKRPKQQSKTGLAYNNQVAGSISGTAYKIGVFESFGWRFEGSCPDCNLVANQNVSNIVLFTKRATKDGYLVVLTVNSGYKDLALNWICWAKRIAFTNYILIAEDQVSAEFFRGLGCSVVVRDDAPTEKSAADFGTVEFQQTLAFRVEFLMTVLEAGFHFVSVDVDGIWLDNPISYFNHDVDLQGQPHGKTEISSGLVVVHATTYGRHFWERMVECQRANARYLATHAAGTYDASKYTEQQCINELSHGLSTPRLFSKANLDPDFFSDGESFFKAHLSQLKGLTPAVIHNDDIAGSSAKLERLHDWQLESVNTEENRCIETPTFSKPDLDNQPINFHIAFVVEPSSSVEKLSRVLERLHSSIPLTNAALFNLEFIFKPKESAVGSDSSIDKFIENFEWMHGVKSILPKSSFANELELYTSIWSAAKDSEVLILLNSDVTLSYFWHTWVNETVESYYVKQYDPNLFGIALERTDAILGESVHDRTGERSPDDVLMADLSFDASEHPLLLFRYQLIPSTSAVFFPQHWRAFLEWYSTFPTKSGSASTLPCVPTLFSNTWLQTYNENYWVGWLHRFAYERGFYSLYAHFDQNTALAILPSNPKFELPTSPSSSKPQAVLLEDSKRLTHYLPAISAIPVYDFHFKHTHVSTTLFWRQNLAPSKYIDQCWMLPARKAVNSSLTSS